ncbi:MAG: lytic transglycosylase domain-containing protein [bacterium]|nr:lytic transglycosylase domain-containing protein [bacterium]
MGSMTPRQSLLLAVLALLAIGPARAEQLVQFVDGRTLAVAAVQREASVAILSWDGGKLQVPAERIENWDEITLGPLQKPKPAPPAAPAPVVAKPWQRRAGRFAEIIQSAAERHSLDPALLTALAEAESSFNPLAVSHKGAMGLLQLMPATAARFGVEDAMDVVQNVEGGARYLSWLLERFEGQTELTLAGYNAGENAVDRYRGIPPYPETRNYVSKVLAGARRLNPAAP